MGSSSSMQQIPESDANREIVIEILSGCVHTINACIDNPEDWDENTIEVVSHMLSMVDSTVDEYDNSIKDAFKMEREQINERLKSSQTMSELLVGLDINGYCEDLIDAI